MTAARERAVRVVAEALAEYLVTDWERDVDAH